MRLRTSLFLLLLATAIPLAGFSVLLSSTLLRQQYNSYVSAIKDRNRAFITAVDTKVNGHITTLQAVAASPALAQDNLARFHAQAKAILASQPEWVNLILLSPEGRHVVNALVPWGVPLNVMTMQPESFAAAVQQKRPTVGNLIPGGAFQQRPGIPIRVPVLRNGEVAYVLTAVLQPESFDQLFEAQGIPTGWVSGLVDANGNFIARIPARPRGSRAGEPFLAAVRSGEEGWYRGMTVDGVDTYTAFTVSRQTGWSVGFAIPTDLVYRPVRHAALIAVGGLLVVLALAMGLALWLSRRITRPMAELGEAAERMGRSATVAATGTRLRELADLEHALNAASAAILARDRELRQQASELQAADANKSQFLAVLSHELRNPLAPLLNGLTILKLRADPQTAARTHAMMERQIGQLRRLIDDLLDVSRIDRGKLDLRTERLAVDAVVRGAIETAKPALEAKQQQLVVRYAREPLYVDGDAVRLGQVVANLLNNAAKFTPANGRIEIETRAADGEAVVCVRDSGIGFPPEDRARIFDSFVQLDTSRSQAAGGLGLGLTLVRALVQMHGGRVEAKSEGPGRGAEFTVHLPLASAPEAAAPVRPTRITPDNARRILVVDDNVDAADTLAELLRIEGFDVRKCYNGADALALSRDFHPDVAFIDLNMPGMSGFELARALRAEPRTRGTRLVALTGMGQKTDVEATRAAGFDAHVTKPASADELRRVANGRQADVVPLGAGRRPGSGP
jgi:signal transduction histidine kinase/ActR/RegA family two-component response regulator